MYSFMREHLAAVLPTILELRQQGMSGFWGLAMA
jgi:hypothetical protein